MRFTQALQHLIIWFKVFRHQQDTQSGNISRTVLIYDTTARRHFRSHQSGALRSTLAWSLILSPNAGAFQPDRSGETVAKAGGKPSLFSLHILPFTLCVTCLFCGVSGKAVSAGLCVSRNSFHFRSSTMARSTRASIRNRQCMQRAINLHLRLDETQLTHLQLYQRLSLKPNSIVLSSKNQRNPHYDARTPPRLLSQSKTPFPTRRRPLLSLPSRDRRLRSISPSCLHA